VAQAIEQASVALLYKLQWRYGRRLIGLEQNRLHTLLMAWMEVREGPSLSLRGDWFRATHRGQRLRC